MSDWSSDVCSSVLSSTSSRNGRRARPSAALFSAKTLRCCSVSPARPYNGPDIIGALLMSFTVPPLSPVLGAEVVGLDLSRPVDDADFARVRDAFHANGLLVFRDQSLSSDMTTSAERRVGKECVITCSSLWSPVNLNKHNILFY